MCWAERLFPLREAGHERRVGAEDRPLRAEAEELNLDLGHVYEPSDEASTPLAADADYGWPVEQTAVEQPELAHTNGR